MRRAQCPQSHSRFMDGLVDACKVPCIYKSFGCVRYVDQHSLAEHSSRSAHVPCYCYECTPPFEGLPASLMHHLTVSLDNHYWPAANIKYETCYPFAVPDLLEDHRRLLVAEEDGSVSLLAMRTSKAHAGYCPVYAVCVWGNATDADTMQLYWCVLTATAPRQAWYHLPPQDDARGLQGGPPRHMHYQVSCSSLVFTQCKPLSKHVDTYFIYSIDPSMHDLALLEYRA
ncbi:hypothetical protein VPH35_051629 [Triticum aestivum]